MNEYHEDQSRGVFGSRLSRRGRSARRPGRVLPWLVPLTCPVRPHPQPLEESS